MTEPIVIDRMEEFREILGRTRAIAVVGISADPERDSYGIASYLRATGYRIVGVNPKHAEILGEPCYPSLSEIPEDVRKEIDLVVVFRRPAAVPPIIEEAARLALRLLWLQMGVSSPEALQTAARLGVGVVSNKCIRVAHGLVRADLVAGAPVGSGRGPSLEASPAPSSEALPEPPPGPQPSPGSGP